MNAQIQLTYYERASIRKSVFIDKRHDVLFVLEAMNESHAWHKHYESGDPLAMYKLIDDIVLKYCEKYGYFEEAERELRASKDINGKRWLSA